VSVGSNRTLTHEEWLAEAAEKFGEDPKGWKFVCPSCNTVQSFQDFKEKTKLDDERIWTVLGFSCIGRWVGHEVKDILTKGGGPCNYAGGGLFRLNPVIVTVKDGEPQQVFEFAPVVDEVRTA